MKPTGPACTEAPEEAEAGKRERAEGNAGGDRVERGLVARFIHVSSWPRCLRPPGKVKVAGVGVAF
jgi:hypothetical protein